MLVTFDGIVALLMIDDTAGIAATPVTLTVDDLLVSLIMPEAVRFFEGLRWFGGFIP